MTSEQIDEMLYELDTFARDDRYMGLSVYSAETMMEMEAIVRKHLSKGQEESL